ncbi:mycothiol acetyltransferase, partial [Cellulomonas bogoriensis 69B4 = DSM 16987]
GDLPAARALAARHGLRPARALWRMAMDLDPGRGTVPPDVPPSTRLRAFVPGRDEQAWLDVNARAFDWHPEQGRMGLPDLRARQDEPWFDPADLLLAERGGRVVAFAWCKLEPGSDEGELYALGVHPDAQGTGLGRALTHVVLAHLAARGRSRAVLFTEATNTAAVRTYRSVGFVTDRVDVQHTTVG